jgi:hypothetical protein
MQPQDVTLPGANSREGHGRFAIDLLAYDSDGQVSMQTVTGTATAGSLASYTLASTFTDICRCGEMADATDLKSVLVKTRCGFESRHRHTLKSVFS